MDSDVTTVIGIRGKLVNAAINGILSPTDAKIILQTHLDKSSFSTWSPVALKISEMSVHHKIICAIGYGKVLEEVTWQDVDLGSEIQACNIRTVNFRANGDRGRGRGAKGLLGGRPTCPHVKFVSSTHDNMIAFWNAVKNAQTIIDLQSSADDDKSDSNTVS